MPALEVSDGEGEKGGSDWLQPLLGRARYSGSQRKAS